MPLRAGANKRMPDRPLILRDFSDNTASRASAIKDSSCSDVSAIKLTHKGFSADKGCCRNHALAASSIGTLHLMNVPLQQVQAADQRIPVIAFNDEKPAGSVSKGSFPFQAG